MPYSDLTAYRKNSQNFDFGGHKIAYWQAGQGPTLVLVHGFPSAAWDWHTLFEALTKQYKVIALDLLGYGISAKPHPHRYSVIEQGDLVVALLKFLSVKQAHFLAHDYGDSVTQEVLARHFNQEIELDIQSVCFLNGGLFAESHRPLMTQKILKSALGPLVAKFMGKSALQRGFNKIFGPHTPPKSYEIDVLWELLGFNKGQRVLPSLLTYIDERQRYRQRWVDAMQNTQVPLCFINGVHDPISGLHMVEQFEREVPHAMCSKLDCGHYPQLEQPELVLKEFLHFQQQC
ncbi:alpha/beta fold hydrolase [Aliiglaciecola sp. M165]|uniref:alpha/beta fold hydrolase n=1 Tax=Aliiglaciecola sp. M165 TaxID=2593649 RepID=UPI00117EE468|nr:alpha/beta hydrolase [Aliiglaciecola sp. M165]TRY29401.1 alpha/beta hydrolase [Aliiglaciecola sp. M165]